MAKRKTLMHGVAPREGADRLAFVIAFILGVFGGIVLKLLGVHPLLTALFAAVVLIGYAVATWANGRFHIDPESIGDNCYYLGFLFTLSSLSFTLYQLAGSEAGGSPVAIPDVISGFGVALSSTIVGVFLRVLMLQMRPDFVAKDRAVRADLNNSLATFKRDMAGSLSQLKAFSTESIQMAAERDERLRVSTEKFVQDYHASLSEAADLLTARVNTSFDKLDDGFEKVLKQLSEKTEQEFSELADRSVTKVTQRLEKHSSDVSEALNGLVSDLSDLRIRLTEEEAKASEVARKNRSSAMKSHQEMLTDLEAHQIEQRRKTKELGAAVELYRVDLEELTKSARDATNAIAERLLPFVQKIEEGLNKTGPWSALSRRNAAPEDVSCEDQTTSSSPNLRALPVWRQSTK